MSAPILVVPRGIQASGKSSAGDQWVADDPENRARVSRDTYRLMFYGSDRVRLSHAQEQHINTVARDTVRTLLNAGVSVYVDEMNLRSRYVRQWEKLTYECGAEVQIMEFPIDVAQAILNDFARGIKVGPRVILDTVAKYQIKDTGDDAKALPPHVPWAPAPEDLIEPYVAPEGAPTAVIFDIDGTVMLNTSGRGWYDYSRVGEDTPNPAMVHMVRAVRDAGHVPIFCSGRSEDCRDVTRRSLSKHVIQISDQHPLFMRASGDERQDAIVKRELFDAHIRDYYDVLAVFDDRNQVVDMWRQLGLMVMHHVDREKGNF